jgi:hypothetical protein
MEAWVPQDVAKSTSFSGNPQRAKVKFVAVPGPCGIDFRPNCRFFVDFVADAGACDEAPRTIIKFGASAWEITVPRGQKTPLTRLFQRPRVPRGHDADHVNRSRPGAARSSGL